MDPIDIQLFTVATGPYDVTPAKQGIVSVVQGDDDSVSLTHEGFTDTDSDIDHYEVALGSTPGGTDLSGGWRDVGSDVSHLFTGLAGRVATNTPVYGSVRAFNGELLETSGTSPKSILFDGTPPVVTDVRIKRTVDELWGAFSCLEYGPDGGCQKATSLLYLNTSEEMFGRFYFSEDCADSNTTQMWFAVGTVPGGNDTMDWTDVGRADQLEGRVFGEPLVVAATGLNMLHNTRYYLNVKTANHRNLVGVFTSPAVLTDFTPPEPVYVREYFLHEPGQSRYWKFDSMLMPGWEFTDPESPVTQHMWILRDRESGTQIGDEHDSGPLHTGLSTDYMEPGRWHQACVKAQNAAGSWNGEYVACADVLIDNTDPVMKEPVWLNPYAADDGWLGNVAAGITRDALFRAARPNLPTGLPEGTLNVAQWNRTVITAAGARVPFVDPAFKHELLWPLGDEEADPFAWFDYAVNGSVPSGQLRPGDRYGALYDPRFINGAQGDFQVLRLRWAVGDPESRVPMTMQEPEVSLNATWWLPPGCLSPCTHPFANSQ